jgi:predicted transcriptional regulator
MGLKVLHPQELEVFYLLPALRKEFAACLKAQGTSQTVIAGILGVTDAAVSQYFSQKRAQDVSFPAEEKKLIASAAKNLTTQAQFIFESQKLLDHFVKTKFTCQLHKQVNADTPSNCNVCFEGN